MTAQRLLRGLYAFVAINLIGSCAALVFLAWLAEGGR